MKRDVKFKKIMDAVTGLKIFCMCSSVLYFFYSIWRCFKLPLTEKLAPVLDILLIPIKANRNTIHTFGENGENAFDVAYIVVSIIFFFLAFVFWAIQKYVPIAETHEELEEIKFKKKQEEDMNRELQNAYVASIEAYRYFSVYLKLKYSFANSAFIDRDKIDLEDSRSLGYQEIVRKMKADFPAMKIEKQGDCIFMTCKTFDRFDLVITYVLSCIKDEKNKYAKDGIIVDFLIATDSYKSEAEAHDAYRTCNAISKLEYSNKAVATLTFKQRYDLLEYSKFKTDYLCNFQDVDNVKSEERELFSLKSKPKHI